MPHYHAADVDVRLAVSDLTSSTTAVPLHKNAQQTQQNLDHVSAAFARAQILPETDVPCLEEETHLHFLGCSPFYFVEARRRSNGTVIHPRATACAASQRQDSRKPTFLESSTPPISSAINDETENASDQSAEPVSARSTRNPRRSSSSTGHLQQGAAPQTPRSTRITDACDRALHLLIRYDSNSACRSLSPRGPAALKFEVFVNGDLASCNFTPARSITQDKVHEALFSGRRFGHIVERAWIICGNPPDSAIPADDDEIMSAAERWSKISRALRKHADKTCGRLSSGGRTPSGEYLERLSGMSIPEELSTRSSKGRKSFALIDVIVALGNGIKDPTSKGYCFSPASLRNSNVVRRKTFIKSPHHTEASSQPTASHAGSMPLIQNKSFGSAPVTPAIGLPYQFASTRPMVFTASSINAVSTETRVPLTPFCDVGQPIDVFDRVDTPEEAGQGLSLSPSSVLGRVAMPSGELTPFLDRKLANLSQDSAAAVRPAPSSQTSRPRLRSSQTSPLSPQQRLARAPYSPKHADIAPGLSPKAGYFDIQWLTQDRIDQGGSNDRDQHVAQVAGALPPSSTTTVPTALEPGKAIMDPPEPALKPRRNRHKMINELRSLRLSPSSSFASVPVLAASPTQVLAGDSRDAQQAGNKKRNLSVESSPLVHAVEEKPEPAFPNRQICATKAHTQSESFKCTFHDKPVECEQRDEAAQDRVPKRRRFPDQHMAEQTMKSWDDAPRQSVRPRPRPSYSGMETPARTAGINTDMPAESRQPPANESDAKAVNASLFRPTSVPAQLNPESAPPFQELNDVTAKTAIKDTKHSDKSKSRTKSASKPRSKSRATQESPNLSQDTSQSLSQPQASSGSGSAALLPFPIPELSKGCVVTYADDNQQRTGGGGLYGVRQVRAQRGGIFNESEVLLGVRFLVVDEPQN